MPHALHDVARRPQCAGKGTLLLLLLPLPIARCEMNGPEWGVPPPPPHLILQGVESLVPAYSAGIASPAPICARRQPRNLGLEAPPPLSPLPPQLCLLPGCLSQLPWVPKSLILSDSPPRGSTGQFHTPSSARRSPKFTAPPLLCDLGQVTQSLWGHFPKR